jgi:hypothetical protein
VKWACLAAVAMLASERLPAQMIVEREQPLDSARVVLRDAVLGIRDSLRTIEAAAARLQRDYRQASPSALELRARVMFEACERTSRALPTARAAVATTKPDSTGQRRQREMLEALSMLRGALTRCEREFGAMSKAGRGEEVRGYGNHRTIQILTAIRAYVPKASTYLAAMGIKVRLPARSGQVSG